MAPRRSAGTRARLALLLVLLVPLAVYADWAARLIQAGVGYEMDEALYVESAVHLLRGGDSPPPFVHEPASWTRVAGRPWPLMIIPYVGATKAYVALPLFAVFGIGAEVARFTGVALAGLGIAGLSVLVAETAGLLPAFLTGILLAIHPSYLDLTVFDNGGTAVWMGAVGLLALALTRHLRRGSPASAFLLGLAAGLSVWARLNVLWLLAAAIVAGAIVFGRRVLPRSGTPRVLACLAAGGLLGSSPLLWYELASRLGTLRYMRSARLPLTPALAWTRLRGAAEVMVADREQRTVWGGPPVETPQILLGAALLLLVVVAAFVPAGSSAEGRSDRASWRRWFAWTALLLLPILAASRLNVTQHHIAAVLPLALAALAILCAELAGRVRALVPVLAIGAAALAAVFLAWDVRIARGLRESGGVRAFSSALDDAARVLAARRIPPARLKIVNWGLQNNLYVVSGGAAWGTELFWGATRSLTAQGRSWDDEVRDGGAFLLFAFPMGPPSIGDGAVGFEEALARYAGQKTETMFRERSGAPCVRLIEIPKPDTPTRPSASP